MDEPPLTEQESQVLIAAARNGDDSALWRLTNGWRPYLKTVASHEVEGQLATRIQESDVVQQALVAAVDQFPSFAGNTLPEWRGWLAAIVRNEARNAVRFWNRQRREVGREQGVGLGSEGYQPADDATRASEHLAQREEAAELLMAIQNLGPEDQQLIQWRNFEGLSHAEIAARLGINAAAVRQRWVTALDRLRHVLRAPSGDNATEK